MRAHGSVRWLAPLLAAGVAGRAGTARADSLTLRYVPSYSYALTTSTDANGVTSRTEAQQFPQRFQLALDKSVYPALVWSGSGTLDWNRTWLNDETSRWTNTEERRWAGTTRLDAGGETLRSTLGYTRTQDSSESTQSGVTSKGASPVSDNYFLSLFLRPADLPTAILSASRIDSYDTTRTQMDSTVNSASLSLDYDKLRSWQLHYAYQYNDSIDHLRQGDTLTQAHAVRVGWADQFLDRRLVTYASYSVGTAATRTTSAGQGAVRETQRLPSAGLSKVESFPDIPTQDTLPPNPALVDSVLTGGAGIDLGSGRTAAGDTAYRDIGAQFPEDRQDLNTVLVWVDRPLADPVVLAFTWSAFVSDDNVSWTPIPITGTVFAILKNRFEITIARTKARYVKVVTRPLPLGVTTEPVYSEILVTEVQFSLVEPLPPGTTRSSEVSGTLTGGGRYLMLKDRNLSYDASFLVAHRDPPLQTRESIQQSLAYLRPLGLRTQLSARLTRNDSIEQSGHFAQHTWGASVTSEPLPALGWNVNYSGGYSSTPAGTDVSNGINAGLHAEIYEGVSHSATVTYRYGEAAGRQNQTAGALAGLTVTPNPTLTATGSFGWNYTDTWGGGISQQLRTGRIDGTLSFNPFPAFYVAASGGRNLFGQTPATQTTLTSGLSLLPAGGLSLRFGFTQTNDTLSETRGRTLTAGLTWTILRGRSLSVFYNHIETRSPVLKYDADSVLASLQLPAF